MKPRIMLTTILAILFLMMLVPATFAKPDNPGGGHPDPEEYEYVASDVGGGGWLHSGTFHPTLPDTILIGSDLAGGIYRTDDFGVKWYPWNEGLANKDHMWSMYVEDLIGVVEPDDTVAFYAATRGGIYRATNDGPWDWAGDDQPRDEFDAVIPEQSLVYWHNDIPEGSWADKGLYREPISFTCLDWNGENLIVAGAGRLRWARDQETRHYPGLDPDLLKSSEDCIVEDTENLDVNNTYPCNSQQSPIWVRDLDHPENGWQPFETPEGFGTPRDISLTKIDGKNYLAVATHAGMWMYDFTADDWHDLADNLYMNWLSGKDPQSVEYGTELTAWSIHLTARGTLFVAMERLDGTFPSGVYHIYDVPTLTGGSWAWTGDLEPVTPHTESLWEIGLGEGFFSQPDLIYLTVVDGEEEDPDTLYLGDRSSSYGLFKGEQPLDFLGVQGPQLAHWTVSVTNVDWTTLYPHDFDEGWVDFWGPEVLFHPVVMPGSSPHRLAVQFNARMHVSDDGGETWDQMYCSGEEGAWTSNGYNELGVMDATFLHDGKPVFSNVDAGTLVGNDPEGSSYEHVHPEIFYNSVPTDNANSGTASDAVHVLFEWEHDIRDEKRDALFINYRPRLDVAEYAKLFMHLYDREEGPVSYDKENPDETDDWFNITSSLPDLDRYLFGDFTFIEDQSCLLSYLYYTGPIRGVDENGDPSVPESYGVLKGVYDSWQEIDGKLQPVWSWEECSEGLLQTVDGTNSRVTRLLYNNYKETNNPKEDGRRIFLTVSWGNDAEGGLYVLEGPEFDTWTKVIHADMQDDDLKLYRDFRSLAQSADGSHLYAGTRGLSTGIGGLLLCKNPSNADDPDEWEILANDPNNIIRPFGFHLNLPFWYEDLSYWGSPDNIDKHLTHIRALAVDPRDPEVVYVGLEDEAFSSLEGLWRFDGEDWEHISSGEPFEGMGIMTLEFNTHVPGQLLIGTNGQGVYLRRVIED